MEPDVSRRRILSTFGVASTFGVTGCLGSNPQSSESTDADITVEITPDRRFDPSSVTITAGQTIEWVNRSRPLQTVTADEDRIPSQQAYFASGGFKREIMARIAYPLLGGLRTGDRYGHTFGEPGTYGYFSIPYERAGMKGTVLVE